jgi:hypothetical protein
MKSGAGVNIVHHDSRHGEAVALSVQAQSSFILPLPRNGGEGRGEGAEEETA